MEQPGVKGKTAIVTGSVAGTVTVLAIGLGWRTGGTAAVDFTKSARETVKAACKGYRLLDANAGTTDFATHAVSPSNPIFDNRMPQM